MTPRAAALSREVARMEETTTFTCPLKRGKPMRGLMRYLGFEERVRGSHHLFDKEGVVEIVNLQSRGGHAKPYQVSQVRRLILKYKLGASD